MPLFKLFITISTTDINSGIVHVILLSIRKPPKLNAHINTGYTIILSIPPKPMTKFIGTLKKRMKTSPIAKRMKAVSDVAPSHKYMYFTGDVRSLQEVKIARMPEVKAIAENRM